MFKFRKKQEKNSITTLDPEQKERLDASVKQYRDQSRKEAFRATLLLGCALVIFLLVLCGGAAILFGTYTITFDLGDGSDPIYETYDLNSGAINLGIPVRSGYHFEGWTGSNGSKPNRDVTVGRGQIGNLSYTANWTDQLTVTCQDWIIDAKGNLIQEITSDVDTFLKSGDSSKDYKVVDREIQVKSGNEVDPARWGNDKSYKAYSDAYMFVGNSGKIKVTEDDIIVYRYFYPVLDVNYLLDDVRPSSLELADADIGRFDLYVDDKRVVQDASDFCSAVAYGSKYEVRMKDINIKYEYVDDGSGFGTMGNSRQNIDISFVTRQVDGEYTVTCEDWVIDANGNRIMEITDSVDNYLNAGKSAKKYAASERQITANSGDVISAATWGSDESRNAYHSDYMYVSCSDDITVTRNNMKVYRYFYPVLDINADVDGEWRSNTKPIAKFNLYVDGELVAENTYDFCQGIPAGSSYRIELTGYDDWTYVYKPGYADDTTIGKYQRTVRLNFKQRSGDSYVSIEDWVVDKDNNRIREITEEVDSYLSSENNQRNYTLQPRIIRASQGEVIDASLIGNDETRKSYSTVYDYIGSSGEILVEGNNTTIYRYFYPVLDVNGLINGKDRGNLGETVFSMFVDGKLVKYGVDDFCQGVPFGSEYEIRNLRLADGYEYIEDEENEENNLSGVMGDEYKSVRLTINSTPEEETTDEAASENSGG